MNVRLAVFTAYHVLHKYQKANPGKVMKVPYTDSHGDYVVAQVPAKEAAQAMQDLIEHVYPESESERYKLITRCQDCKHYRTLKKKKNPRVKKHVCKLDGEVKTPDFFCGHAVPKE